jgi:hypothetical protein
MGWRASRCASRCRRGPVLISIAELRATSSTYLIVDTKCLVRVLDQLMHGECSVVGLDNGIGHLRRWHHGEGSHHTIGEFLANLRDQKRTHTGTSSTTERVGDLEALEAVTPLSLTTHHIEDLVHQFCTLSVMALCPVVTSTRLTKDEVVRTEELAKRSSTDGVHGTRLEVDQDGTGNILVARCL